MPDDPAALASDDGREVEVVDARIAVYAALRRLPADQAEAILAVDVYGLSVSEAAEVLGIASGTVKSRRARARSRLSRLLR